MESLPNSRYSPGSEDAITQILHSSSEAAFLMRARGNIVVESNDVWAQLTGYTRGEMVGETALQFVYFLDPDLWIQVLQQLEAGDEIRDLATRIFRKDRTLADVLISLRQVMIDNEPCYLTLIRENTERRQANEVAGSRGEQRSCALEPLFLPGEEISEEEIGQAIDFQGIQEMMNFFYKITRIGIGITDNLGNVRVAAGWQDICTKFHRMHPEALAGCKESDIYLSQMVNTGKYALYKCKNNMWDIATPLNIGGRHIANLFLGQFFFEDEVPDYDLFRIQAEKFGFDRDEYLAALDRVPRWSRETVDNAMEFYTRLAVMISRLSLGNIQLAKSLHAQRSAREALQKSEQRFRSLVETTSDWVWEVDRDGIYTYASPKSKELLGYEPDEIIGKTPFDFMPPEEAELAAGVFQTIRASCQAFRGLENTNLHRDGRRVVLDTSGVPIVDEQGNFLGFRGIDRDITDRKRAEEEIRKHRDHLEELVKERTLELMVAKEEADTANRAKSEFLANMSHELRTPLNAILGYSQLMQRTAASLDPIHREYLQTINRSGEHLLTLINDVLEISKIEARRITLKPHTFDLPALLRDLACMFRARIKAKGLFFNLELDRGLPRHVVADANRFRQVLINLLDNALKFTEKGSIVLRVAVQDACSEKFSLVVEVEDTGPGIAAEELDKVFQVFEQTATGKRQQSGTGLGMAISREYVRMMGGDLTVTSRLGVGSIFQFNICACRGKEADSRENNRQQRVTGLAPGQPIPRILVVEDNQENRVLLVRLLTEVGCAVREAENGAQAVEVSAQWAPQFIWMDIRMPVMDGLEATRRIKAAPGGAEVRIVAFTASALAVEREAIGAAGFDDFVTKPYREADIFRVMAEQIGLTYLFEHEDPARSIDPETALHPRDLAHLPAGLRADLLQAVLELDTERIETVVTAIERQDGVIGPVLRTFAENMEYERLLALLEGNSADPQGM